MAEQIKVPGVLKPGTGDYHSYAKDIIDDQLRNKKQSELNALFNQGKGIDKNGNIVPVAGGEAIDADDISYTEKVSPNSHKTGSVGKKVKELEDRINDLVPGEEYVSDTVIDLIDYMLDGSTPQSFTYDSDTKYVYGGKVTTMCTYARNNTSYAAFKVVDIDKYIVYTIYDNTFTYYNELNSETLSNEARSKFELGKYALVKQLEGKTGDSWVDGKVGVFVDSSNRPMSFRYISSVEIYGQTLNNVLLGKTADGTNIYVYNLSSGLFKFYNRISSNDSAFEALNNLIVGASGGGITGAAVNGSEVPKNGTILQFPTYPTSGTMSYSDSTNYDAGSIGKAVKDAKVAANVSFDDSLTQLGTEENPITDTQSAINAIVTAIASSISVLVIKLIDHNNNNIVGQSVVINETYNGTTNTYTVNTESNGIAVCSIHYGSVYTIIYQNRTNSFTPTSVTGIAENIHINIFAKYNLNADYENIHCYVKIKGVNINNYNVNNKKLYIDYKYNNNDTITYIRKYTIVLNSSGTIKTIYDENNTEVANCTIPKNQYYRVSLEDYTDMDKTADLEYKSEYFDRTITMYYYYKLSGVFLVVEDYIDNVDTNEYSEYKCINFDDVENKITIIDSNNDSWDIIKDVTTGNLMKSPVGQENYSIWIESNNFNRILGIGLRTSSSIDALINNSEAESQGFTDSSMLLTNKALVAGYYSTEASNIPGVDNSYSGKYLTQVMVDSTDPYSQIANNMINVTLKTGNVTQKAFILTWGQARDLYQNKTLIRQIASVINFTTLINTFNWSSIPVCSVITRPAYWRVLQSGVNELYNAPVKTASQSCLPIFSF